VNMKSTKAQVTQRVEEVFKLRLGGAEFSDIRQYASAPEQQWNVSDRQLWRYIAAADALVKQRFDARADHLLARHCLQRRLLYAHALAAGDHATALRILDSEAKLEALFPPVKVAPTTPDGKEPYAPLSDDERRAALDRLYAAVGAGGRGADPQQPADPDGQILGEPGAAAG